MTSKGYFVSDLHLFSNRSLGAAHWESLHQAASQARLFVLGGDIFDFRWTTLDSIDCTAKAAISWLEQLVAPHPHCEFHFVLGNHDFHRQFTPRLKEFAEATPNLDWHPYYLRRGGSFFLHGDVCHRPLTHEALVTARDRCHHRQVKSKSANKIYDMVVQAGLHRMAQTVASRPEKVARNLSCYLDDIGHNAASGVKHVYFGHTHVPMSHYRHGGLTFHNGGAPIKGLQFRIVETEVEVAAEPAAM